MRKPLVIGAIAAVVAGVLAYVLLMPHPKDGSLEWHKNRYLKERKKIERRTILDQLERTYVKIRKPRNYSFRSVSGKELQKHTEALIGLGFLEAKRIDVKNPLAGYLNSILANGWAVIPEERQRFTELSVPPAPDIDSPSHVNVLAPQQDMALWERLIRTADASVPPDPREGTRSLKLLAPDKVPEPAGLDEVLREKDNVRRPTP